MSEQLSV